MSSDDVKRYSMVEDDKEFTDRNGKWMPYADHRRIVEGLEEQLDHTETDRQGLEGLLKQLSDAYGCKQYRFTEAVKRAIALKEKP